MNGIELPIATEKITPFHISVTQDAIDDLKARLKATRFPTEQTVSDWSQGVPLSNAKALIRYWETEYDWRRFEAELNSFPHFRTLIDGLGIHFIHVSSRHANALPIILTHGWPGSIAEFLKIIGPLTDPTAHGGRAEDAFHVVIPSLPGFGFSDKPRKTGWNLPRIAEAWSVLMRRLGYDRWVAQGGDWGARTTTVLGQLMPPGLIGIHLNFQYVFPETMPAKLSREEQRAVDSVNASLSEGFRQLHSTRPQTIGYALADSPAGQALWIYEKFYAWTDNNGAPEDALSMDQMLDDISIYWFTNTATSSARIYWENRGVSFAGGKVTLPVAASVFPRDFFCAPRPWAEQTYTNLMYWNELDRGGHFAASEEPELFVQELRAAFSSLRYAAQYRFSR